MKRERGFKTINHEITVYKSIGNHVVMLSLPVGTRIYVGCWNLNKQKCRADQARVVAIFKLSSSGDYISDIKSNRSSWCAEITYRVGEIVKPKRPFHTLELECASGIHFFYTLKEAMRWGGIPFKTS